MSTLMKVLSRDEIERLAAYYDTQDPEAEIGSMLREGTWALHQNGKHFKLTDNIDDDSNWLGISDEVLRKAQIEQPETPADRHRRTGDAYHHAFAAVCRHVGDCERCAWFGDQCSTREELMATMLLARRAHRGA